MSEGKELNSIRKDTSVADEGAGTQPSARRLATDDGWDPVEEDDSWAPDSSIDQLEAMMSQDDSATRAVITASGTFDAPMHHNPLPDEAAHRARPAADSNEAILCSGVQERVEAGPWHASPVDAPPTAGDGVRSSARRYGNQASQTGSRRDRRQSSVEEAYNSNEAILGSDIVVGVGAASGGPSGREPLPSRADAPSRPVSDPVESRPTAWLIPGIVCVGGVGAGAYVFAGASPILGGIAIALAMVGSLFLRVLLKH